MQKLSELLTTKYKVFGITYSKKVKHVFKTDTQHKVFKGCITEIYVFGVLVKKIGLTRQTF